MNLLASKIRNGRIALGYSQGYVSKKNEHISANIFVTGKRPLKTDYATLNTVMPNIKN